MRTGNIGIPRCLSEKDRVRVMSHPRLHPQESSNKSVHSIELVEFYLGISFLASGMTCRRISERYTKNVWFFACF